METRSILQTQLGSDVGANWVSADTLGLTQPTTGFATGLVFNVQQGTGWPFALDNDMVPPRGLDPPRIVSLSALVVLTSVGVGDLTFDLSFVNDPQFEDFSTAALPLTWARTTLWTGLVLTGGAANFTLPFTETQVEPIRVMAASSYWRGRLGLVMENVTNGALGAALLWMPNIAQPTWSWTLEHFFTGTLGPSGPGQRSVRDGRFGMPALNTELVEDGYEPGLWVRPDDRDPEDEADSYVPRPTEGAVDDEVPS